MHIKRGLMGVTPSYVAALYRQWQRKEPARKPASDFFWGDGFGGGTDLASGAALARGNATQFSAICCVNRVVVAQATQHHPRGVACIAPIVSR